MAASDNADVVTSLQQVTTADVITGLHDVTNGTYVKFHHQGGPQLLSYPAQVFITIAYVTVVILSVCGNSLVVATVVCQRSMRTVTNWFIVNLACADMMMAALCVPITFVSEVLLRRWPFGATLCPLTGYVQTASVFLGSFTMISISIDRHRAIRHPLRARLSGRRLLLAVGLAWTAALVLPIPIAVFNRMVARREDAMTPLNASTSLDDVISDTTLLMTMTMSADQGAQSVTALDGSDDVSDDVSFDAYFDCEENWPDWLLPGTQWRSLYSMTIMVAQYFVPLAVLTTTYSSITYVIWFKRRPPGEPLSERDNRLAASKKMMVKMMITVVLIYALCWLPLHTITIVGDADPSIWESNYIQTIWLSAHWLAMSSCCYNPIVYYWMSSNFRSGYIQVLRRCVCYGGSHATRTNSRQNTVRGVITSARTRRSVSSRRHGWWRWWWCSMAASSTVDADAYSEVVDSSMIVLSTVERYNTSGEHHQLDEVELDDVVAKKESSSVTILSMNFAAPLPLITVTVSSP